jgi:hypothetical protein
MRYKLRASGGPHAVFYRDGRRRDNMPLREGTVVRDATAADRAEVPADIEGSIAWHRDERVRLGFAGVFVVPGEGVAALYGCRPVPLDGPA